MSEYDGPDHEPDFDDPSYADVSALLAGAKVGEPIPAAVAAELNETLANLIAQRSKEQATPDPVVVPLRRRTVPSRFLVAASTVVLLGAGAVGVTAMLQDSGSDDKASTADSSVALDAPAAPEAASGGGTASGSTDDAAGVPQSLGNLSLTYGAGTLPSFSAGGFSQQATAFVAGTRYLDLAGVPTSGEAPPEPQAVSPDSDCVTCHDAGGDTGPGATSGDAPEDRVDGLASKAEREQSRQQLLRSYAATPACPGPAVTDGSTVVRIRFAKKPATLVVHPVADGRRLVEAWSCDGSRRLASTTVPAS